MRFTLLVITLFVGMILSSCKKKDDILNPIPYIEIDSVSPTTVQQFAQRVRIVLTYDDQDGDLGFQNPDSMSVFVQDSRLDTADTYHIPPVGPTDQVLHIRGSFAIDLQAPFLLGTGLEEKIRYTIQVKDRAGNYSNTVQTEEITITQ